MAVYGFEVYGAGIIGLFALALGVCQLLLRAVLEGQAHGEEVVRRTDQLDIRHEGMVGLLLETLALRDPTAARHAAAVAHYAHELARAAGLSEREQAVVHTAGLLHDIGKEALPDHILLGRSELHAAERRLVERHPADGARLLLRVEGLGEVANAVLAHHERIDGHGYPDGLAGDDIPMTARILAIAEVYDVLTAPDSYKIPLGAAEAEDELRRVAGIAARRPARLAVRHPGAARHGHRPRGPDRRPRDRAPDPAPHARRARPAAGAGSADRLERELVLDRVAVVAGAQEAEPVQQRDRRAVVPQRRSRSGASSRWRAPPRPAGPRGGCRRRGPATRRRR